MTEVSLATNRAEARPSDPLLRQPIVDWMADDIGINLVEFEDETLAYINNVREIESSGGWNTTGPADPDTGNRALGDFQWFPVPFREDLEAARLYYGPRKANLVEPDLI